MFVRLDVAEMFMQSFLKTGDVTVCGYALKPSFTVFNLLPAL
jgi:hypothetical protein